MFETLTSFPPLARASSLVAAPVEKIIFETGEITYLYDATGAKLKKTMTDIEVGGEAINI